MTGKLTHGHTAGPAKRRKRTREYHSWCAMKARCQNPKNDRYARYGGRGIKVCDRWQSFENFLADMGPCPPGMTIDRETNQDNYEPGRCRWATDEEQANKRSNNRLITFDGVTRTVAQWAEARGMTYSKLISRIQRAWPIAVALDPGAGMRPVKRPRQKRSWPTITCAECNTPFVATMQKARFCSDACRKRRCKRDWHRANAERNNALRRAKMAAKRGAAA